MDAHVPTGDVVAVVGAGHIAGMQREWAKYPFTSQEDIQKRKEMLLRTSEDKDYSLELLR